MSDQLAQDTRDIYLLLDRNYTLWDDPTEATGFAADLERLHGLRAEPAGHEEHSGFSDHFNFTRDNRNVEQIRKAQQLVIDAMRPERGRVLSLGIGNGKTASEWATAEQQLIGVDLHAGYLDRARELLPSLETHVLDLNAQRLELGQFQAIECTMVLHHIRDFADVVAQISGSLEPGGLFVYADLVDKTEPEAEMLFTEVHAHPPYHGREYFRSQRQIREAIESHLKIETCTRIGPGIAFWTARRK